jgi:hypothetical protein
MIIILFLELLAQVECAFTLFNSYSLGSSTLLATIASQDKTMFIASFGDRTFSLYTSLAGPASALPTPLAPIRNILLTPDKKVLVGL